MRSAGFAVLALLLMRCAPAQGQYANAVEPPLLAHTCTHASLQSLTLSHTRLDLATNSQAVISIQATSAGAQAFTIQTTAPWLSVFPRDGIVGPDPIQLQVSVNRARLWVGANAAAIIVRDARGLPATVGVTAVKFPTTPRLIPWVEANVADEAEAQFVAEGLRIWRHVTDTAVVSTGPGHAGLFPRLRAAVPGLCLIPGLKTSPRLLPHGVDSQLAWQLIASDIEEFVAAAGEPRILLENETAFAGYLIDGEPLNLHRLAAALTALPPNVEIWWYPAISVHADPLIRRRSRELIAAVAAVVPCRFVDLSYADPTWPAWPPSIEARRELARLSNRVPRPLLYVGGMGSWVYWDEVSIRTALVQLRHYPAALVYPGSTRWIESAQALTAALADYDASRPGAALPGDPHALPDFPAGSPTAPSAP